jgi:Tfp pilus assembly protein PilF
MPETTRPKPQKVNKSAIGAFTMDPFHIDGHMAMELLMAEQGNMEKAVHYFTKILKIAPMNAHAQKYMGMAKFQQGNLEQAVFCLSKALEIMPDDGVVINDLAEAIAKSKKIR